MAGGMLLQSAATTGNGSAFNFRGASGRYLLSVEPSGTVSGGTVTFEHAPSTSYSGTWSPLTSAISPSTGVLSAVHVEGAFHAVRARISSDITGGGSVTCRISPPIIPDGV